MPTFTRPKNTRPARIIRWRDGDTLVVLIPLGFGCYIEQSLRLEGIESWEPSGPTKPKAIAVRDALNTLTSGRDCLLHLRSERHDNHDRLHGQVTIGDQDLAALLVDKGFAWHATKAESTAAHRDGVQHQPTNTEAPCLQESPAS